MGSHEDVLIALRAEDGAALRAALTGDAPVPVPILCDLLPRHWHDLHEDIVFKLGLIGNPAAVDSISGAAAIPFESLVQWGNFAEFQRKCAFALARIATEESHLALEMLAESDDPNLREFALEGLAHWPLPHRRAWEPVFTPRSLKTGLTETETTWGRGPWPTRCGYSLCHAENPAEAVSGRVRSASKAFPERQPLQI